MVGYKKILLSILPCVLILASLNSVAGEIVFFSLSPIAYCSLGRCGYRVFFCSGFFVNLTFQDHYRVAFIDYMGSIYGNLLFIALLIILALPYCLIPIIYGIKVFKTPLSRACISVVIVVLIWIGTDYLLPSKYWIALADMPWALWLVRQGGETLLVVSIGIISMLFVYAVLHKRMIFRFISVLILSLLFGLDWLSSPDFCSSSSKLPGSVIGVQFGPSFDNESHTGNLKSVSELYKLVSAYYSVSSTVSAGWLGVMPELTSAEFIDIEDGISFYKALSDDLMASFVVNGVVLAPDGKNLYRASRIVSEGGSASRIILKSFLFPIFETLENERGVRYLKGKDNKKTVSSPWGNVQALLCFELFGRSYSNQGGDTPSLVVVEADTSRFRHPSVDGYILRSAIFKSQSVKAPVIVASYSGPSFIAWPNGKGYEITKKNESAAYVIDSDGNHNTTPMLW